MNFIYIDISNAILLVYQMYIKRYNKMDILIDSKKKIFNDELICFYCSQSEIEMKLK